MNHRPSFFARLFGESPEENDFAVRFSNGTLLALLLPLVAEQFLSILMGIMDTVMVSSLGDASVSGVSLVDMIFILFINIFNALATGGAVIASRCVGAKKPEDARRAANSVFLISLSASLLILGAVAVADTRLLALLYGSVEADVMGASAVYMRVCVISFPFIALYSASAALFRSVGNSKISMIASTAANLVNVAGNALTIFVFRWGVFGAAVSTVFSRFLLMVYFLVKIADRKLEVSVDYRALFTKKPDLPSVRSILGVGLPGSLESGTFQLGRILVLSIISTFGTAQIAANRHHHRRRPVRRSRGLAGRSVLLREADPHELRRLRPLQRGPVRRHAPAAPALPRVRGSGKARADPHPHPQPLRDPALDALLRHPQRHEGRRGRAVRHDRRGGVHVRLPGGRLRDPRAQDGDGRGGRLDRDGDRLDLPVRRVRREVGADPEKPRESPA